MMQSFLKLSTICSLAAALVAPAQVVAQSSSQGSWPTKPIRLITPMPPGSPPDAMARVLSLHLGKSLGQPVIIENRPGATGTIGINVVAKAPADGLTLGVMSMPFVVAPSLIKQIPYNSATDIIPVSQVVWGTNVLVVSATSPIRSVEDLVALARSGKSEVTFSSGSNGTPAHLAGELFQRSAKAPMLHIPYKGAAEGVNAVLSGDVNMMFAAMGTAIPFIKSNKLRALAIATPVRHKSLPDVPTLAERGFEGFDVRDWQGIVAPAGTPPEVVARLDKEIKKILAIPEVRNTFETLGMDAVEAGSPEQFSVQMRADQVRWNKVIRDAGIQAN